MIISYLVGMYIISLLNACILSIFYRKQLNIYITALFYSIVVANFGSLALALSKSLEGAIVAIRITYLGACFLPLFLLLVILNLAKFKLPELAKVLLIVFCSIVFALSYTIGYTDIYYKSIQFISENGIGNYIVDFGPAHILWDVLLVGFTLANIFVIIYAAKEKKNVSYRNLASIAFLEVMTIILFIIARAFNIDPLAMPLIYVFDEFVLIYICTHIKMYDIEHAILDALQEENDSAFIAFSNNGKYLGCNNIALQYFPELENYRVDKIPDSEDEVSVFFRDHLSDGKLPDEKTAVSFTHKDRMYNVTASLVKATPGSRKVLFHIEDITQTQNYIKWLDSNNTELADKVKNNQKRIHALQEQIIIGMAKMVESRDANTGGHIKRSSDGVAILIKEMRKDKSLNYSDEFYNSVIAAAPMHDLGKIAIDDRVLRKPGKFTDAEFAEMKTHPTKGAAIVENLLGNIEAPEFVEIARNVALCHHERWDGSGYPNKLVGENIPFEARIMAIADVYDALVSKRCYKEKMSFEAANNIITSSMGTHFDPSLKKYYEACRPQLEAYYSSLD